MVVKFENVRLDVRPDTAHEWLLETRLVAEAYGVSVDAILAHRTRNPEDFIDGKHFIATADKLSAVGQKPNQIFWTKRGVIRLGFFVKSERARKFRDWAEELIISKLDAEPLRISTAIKKKIAAGAELMGSQNKLSKWLGVTNGVVSFFQNPHNHHLLSNEMIAYVESRLDYLLALQQTDFNPPVRAMLIGQTPEQIRISIVEMMSGPLPQKVRILLKDVFVLTEQLDKAITKAQVLSVTLPEGVQKGGQVL